MRSSLSRVIIEKIIYFSRGTLSFINPSSYSSISSIAIGASPWIPYFMSFFLIPSSLGISKRAGNDCYSITPSTASG